MVKRNKYFCYYCDVIYTVIWTVIMSVSELQEIVKDREAWRAAVHGVTELDTTEWLNNEEQQLWFVKTYIWSS